jgi:HD-GYP domain-containing protein (c-di-GMP phosphodiesterase class II)
LSTDRSISIYLRFAGASAVAIALIAGLLAFSGMQLVRSSQQEAAAQSASATLGAPLGQLFAAVPPGQPVPASVTEAAGALTQPLLSASLRGVRVWGSGNAPVYSNGAGRPPAQAAPRGGGTSSAFAAAADGSGLFVTYAPGGGYTVEIDQASGPLDASITGAQRVLVIVVAALAVVAYALLQACFWFGVSRFAEGHRRLRYMYNTGDEIRSSLDLHEVVTHLSRDATRLARGDFGLVALFDAGLGDLILKATYDGALDAISHHQRAVEEWFLRRCVATNTTVTTVQPARAYRQFFGYEAELDGQVHLLCAPVALRDRVVGVTAVVRQVGGKRGGFTATEIAQVEELAGQAVTAIEQAELFARVRGHADEIELSYDATLKALMAALDAKDEVTEGHCERVAKLTIQLAKHMGMPEQQLIDIERGALLHDVGKIGVPDAVLKKPAALNDGEWEAMRKHPLLASLMVSKIGFLENAMPILLYHHEQYDGAGYPFGLSGDKIPLEARLFSVIDAYDAMTSDRPYRDAMSHDVAMAEVALNSGRQFDPDVVAAFEELMLTRPELRHLVPHRHDGSEHDADDTTMAATEDAA